MKKEKMLLGVCLWLSERLKVNIAVLRLLFAATALFGLRVPVLSISPLVLYMVLYLFKPKEYENR